MLRYLVRRCTTLLLTIALLFAQGHASPSRAMVAAIDAMSSVLGKQYNADRVDKVLCQIGYCTEFTSTIAEWDKLSVYRRIETMAVAAERGGAGSAKRALALMARALAQDYPSLLEDPAIVAISPRPVHGALEFAQLTAPSPARLAPRLDAAVYAIARHIDDGTMAASILLHKAGMSDRAIMALVREHSTVRDVLRAAVATREAEAQPGFVDRMIVILARTHPAIREDPAIDVFRCQQAVTAKRYRSSGPATEPPAPKQRRRLAPPPGGPMCTP